MMLGCLRIWSVVVILLAVAGQARADVSLGEIDEAIATTSYDQALTLVNAGLVAAPGDVALRSRRARIHGYLGNLDAALDDLNVLRAEYPYDVDHVLARARLLARQGKDQAALTDLRQGVALAPDYEEVWRLRYQILARQPDDRSQLELEAVRLDAANRFPDASWWQLPDERPETGWSAQVGAAYEDLDNNLSSWGQQFVELSREHDAHGRYYLGLARDDRFGNADLTISFGGQRQFGNGWSAGLGVAFVDDPQFQPDYGYSANLGKSLANGWVLNLQYRRREYETATVGTTTGLMEKYVGEFRIAYALGLSHLHGASNSLGHTLTANWYYNDRSSIGLSVNTGEETEAIAPGQVLETDVRGLSVTGRRDISERLTLNWWLGLHDQGDFYRRQFLGMALTIRL